MNTNLTVRVEESLKRQAEEACRDLDLTMSQIVRAALRQVVGQRERFRIAPASTVDRQVLGSKVASSVERQAVAARRKRIGELEQLERRNELNKATRQELAQLRKHEVCR